MDTIFVLSPAFCYYKNHDGSYDFQQENTERLLAQITPDPTQVSQKAPYSWACTGSFPQNPFLCCALLLSHLTWKHKGTTDSRTSPLVTISSMAALSVHSLGRAPVGQNFSTFPALTNWGTYSRGSVSQRTPAMQFKRALGFTQTILEGPWVCWDDGMLRTRMQPCQIYFKKIKCCNY